MTEIDDEELARRSSKIGADLVGHLEAAYAEDDGLTHGVAAMHAAVVCLLVNGQSVDEIVALAQDHATSIEHQLEELAPIFEGPPS